MRFDKQVRFELWGNFDHEHEAIGIHARPDFVRGNFLRRLEKGLEKGLLDAARDFRMVLVDDGDGGMLDSELGAGCHGINGVSERVYNQYQHDWIGADAEQFLDAEGKNIGEPLSHLRAPVS